MENMELDLRNTTPTTFWHKPKDVWGSPRGAVLRIQALAVVAIIIAFLLVAFGSCRRWSNRWIIQKGFFAAHALSLSLGIYSIGIMQSSSVKSEMYPIWTVSLFTLFSSVDPVTAYNGLDYKGPLSKMVYQICLYFGYVFLMSISIISSNVGNTAINVLSAISFIKGFHRSLALLQQSRMRKMVQKIKDGGGLLMLARSLQQRRHLLLEIPDDLPEDITPEDIQEFERPGEGFWMFPEIVSMADIDDVCKREDKLESCYDVCVSFCLSHKLQRYFLGLNDHDSVTVNMDDFKDRDDNYTLSKNKQLQIEKQILYEEPKPVVDYERALKVIEVELAFLYDVFFTGNVFLHYYQAKAASLWSLASFTGICFVGIVAAIPGTRASRPTTSHGPGASTIVVDTTTLDLVITLVILVSLTLVELTQLIRCWASNWAKVAVVSEYAREMRKKFKEAVCCKGDQGEEDDRMKWSWQMKLKAFVVTRTNRWFDKYLWQDKLGQYSLKDKEGSSYDSSSDRRGGIISWLQTAYKKCHRFIRMIGLDYIREVLWDLLGRDGNKGAAIRLDNDVKRSIIKFLEQIRTDTIDGNWFSFLTENGLALDEVPYGTKARSEQLYAHFVVQWHSVTERLAEHDKQEDAMRKEDRIGCKETFANCLKKAAAVAGFRKNEAGGGEGEVEEREKNRRVAIALSRYCAYLLVSAPDLLPGRLLPVQDAETVRSMKAGCHVPDLIDQLLGRKDLPPDSRRCSDHWKVLTLVWVRMLVYAAPYGNAEAHMRHLSHGGELITHLWALLYHLNICAWKQFNEKHVVALTDSGFSDMIRTRRRVMVSFYNPSWSQSEELAPEYAAAAAYLADQKVDVVLAKVDTTKDTDLAQRYEVRKEFLTILFFVDGIPSPYAGAKTKTAIVDWINKNLNPGVHDIANVDDAKRIRNEINGSAVVAFLVHPSSPHSAELAAASRLEDGVRFYRTFKPDVAEVFHLDPAANRPSLIFMNKEMKKFTLYDGEFSKYTIADFVFLNNRPLVTTLTRENWASILVAPLFKKKIFLFAAGDESSKFLPIFKEAAKSFTGNLLFVFADRGNQDIISAVKYFNICGEETTVLALYKSEWTFSLSGEISQDTIKKFAQDLLEDNLYKMTSPVPESNDGDVKIVVGENLKQIVLDESKDVLLEIYEPWSWDCRALEPTYNKLAKHLHGIESLVIAKMDGSTNEHPRAQSHGYPTILFYPAGKKSSEPITFEWEKTVEEMYKFIKKHAGIPFKGELITTERREQGGWRTDQ